MQLSGMVLFIIGLAYAWSYLPGHGRGEPTGGSAGKCHQVLGTILVALAVLQVSGILGGAARSLEWPWWRW